jgi:hypothetical protein
MNKSPLSFQAVTVFYTQTVVKNTKINILAVYLLKWIHLAAQVYSVPQIYEQCTHESSPVSGTRVFRQSARQATTHSFRLPNKQAIIYLARPCNIDASFCTSSSTKGHTHTRM